jgi:transposase-like protein
MPATANTQKNVPQAEFSLRAKTQMLRLQLNVTQVARALGLNRNTVSLAINRGLYEPTRQRIANFLNIPL